MSSIDGYKQVISEDEYDYCESMAPSHLSSDSFRTKSGSSLSKENWREKYLALLDDVVDLLDILDEIYGIERHS